MGEESNRQIDLEQSKIGTLETEADKVKGEKDLQKKLKEHHGQFFEQVDSAQTVLKDAESKITDTDLRSALDVEQKGMFDFLAGAAEKGREILLKEKRNQKGETSHFKHIDSMAALLHGITERADKVSVSVKALQEAQKNMDTTKPLLEIVNEIRDNEKLNPAQKREQLLAAADNAIDGLAKAKKSISAADRDKLAEVNLEYIYKETSDSINTNLADMAEIKVAYRVMDFIEKHGTEEIATVTTEESMGEFGGMSSGMGYTAESPSLVKTKKVYLTIDEYGNVRKTRDFNALPPEKQILLWNELKLIRDQVNEEIKKKCVDEKQEAHLINFYDGKAKMYAGDDLGAKTDLLIFYNAETKRPPEEQEKHSMQIDEAREFLKLIAKREIAEMKQRYQLMRADVDAAYANIISPGPTTFGATKTSANTVLDRLEIVLFEAEQQIESGNALTVNDAATKLRKMQIKQETRNSNALRLFQEGHLFDAKETAGWVRLQAFDVFSQQKMLNEPDPVKRMENIKALAEKARSMGLTEVAKHYYEMYFQKEISNEAKKVSRENIRWLIMRDRKIRTEIETRYGQWEQDFAASYKAEKNRQFRLANPNEPIPETPPEEIHNAYEEQRPTARRSIMEAMINDRFNAQIKIRVNAKMKNATGERADTWSNTYNQFFSSLEKIPGNITIVSDAEWEQLKATILPQLIILAASGTVAGGVARALVGTALRDALIASGMEAAAIDVAAGRGSGHFTTMVVRQLGPAQAAKYGAASFGVETAAFTATNGALNALVFNDTSVFADPEAFAKAWGHGALMLGACKAGNMGYSFVPKPKGFVGKIGYKGGELGTEVAALNAATLGLSIVTNEEITEQQMIDMTKDNIIFCVGLRAGHALTGSITGPPEMAEWRSKRIDRGEARRWRGSEYETPKKLSPSERAKRRTEAIETFKLILKSPRPDAAKRLIEFKKNAPKDLRPRLEILEAQFKNRQKEYEKGVSDVTADVTRQVTSGNFKSSNEVEAYVENYNRTNTNKPKQLVPLGNRLITVLPDSMGEIYLNKEGQLVFRRTDKIEVNDPQLLLRLPKDGVDLNPFHGNKHMMAANESCKKILADLGITSLTPGKPIFVELDLNHPMVAEKMKTFKQQMGENVKIGVTLTGRIATSEAETGLMNGMPVTFLDILPTIIKDGKPYRILEIPENWSKLDTDANINKEINQIFLPSEVIRSGKDGYALMPIISNIDHPTTITREEYSDFMARLRKARINPSCDLDSAPADGSIPSEINLVRYNGKLYISDAGDVFMRDAYGKRADPDTVKSYHDSLSFRIVEGSKKQPNLEIKDTKQLDNLKQDVDQRIHSNERVPEQLRPILRSLYQKLQALFPSLQAESYEQSTEKKNRNKISVGEKYLEQIDALSKFFFSHLVSDVKITSEALDTDFPGSSAKVTSANIEGGQTDIAAKVYKSTDLQAIAYAMREGLDIKIAGDIGVGPKFHGFFINGNGQIVVLMEKVNGYQLSGDGAYYVNDRTISEFNQKLNQLHNAGYAFAGEGGQIMVDKDGRLGFIDITLTRLNSQGRKKVGSNEWIDPYNDDILQDRLASLYKYRDMGTKEGEKVSFFNDEGTGINWDWEVISYDKDTQMATVRGQNERGQTLRTTLPVSDLRREIMISRDIAKIPPVFSFSHPNTRKIYTDGHIQYVNPRTGEITVNGLCNNKREAVNFKSALYLDMYIRYVSGRR